LKIDEMSQHCRFYVRVNPTTTSDFGDNLTAIFRRGLSGVVVPKVEGPGELASVNARIDSRASKTGLDPGAIEMMATIETALGVRAVYDVASVGGHLNRLCFGSVDFALDLGLDRPDEKGASEILLWAKSQLVLASWVAGLEPPHDGAYSNYLDLEGLTCEARQSRRSVSRANT
jgi:citrate lyase subunit beta/citryl-CoA lyase